MPQTTFEYELTDSLKATEDLNVNLYAAKIGGHALRIEKHSSWATSLSWDLPEQYGLEDFLAAVENAFQEADEQGHEAEEYAMVIGTSAFDGTEQADEWEDPQEFSYIRPLEVDDFAAMDLSPDQVNFLRIYGDLAHFAYNSPPRGHISLIFDPKPHQLISAFRFTAEMMPPALNLEPKQIGEFVMSLPFPESP